MNIKDLSKMDIKDIQKIDWLKVAQNARKRPDIIICVVVSLITVLFSINYFTKRQKEVESTKTEITTLEKKIALIEEYNKVDTELNKFIDNIPEEITEEMLINQIADFAQARKVQIKSFSPSKNVITPLYNLTSIVMNVTATEYKNLWLFIYDIENSQYMLRIDSWNGASEASMRDSGRRRSSQGDADPSSISVALEIASINIKNTNE